MSVPINALHDTRNRLTGLVQSGQTIQYRYDVIGRRTGVSLNNGASWTRFSHAGGMETGELNDAGQYLQRYIPGPGIDQREAMITVNPSTGAATARHYYHANRLGSVIALADASGALSDRYVYTPYGVEAPLNTSGNPFRYTGRRYDPESGLYYYRARYYWPEIGRFLQTDPIGYADQMNLYAYVGNNPLNATDPSGEQSRPFGSRGRGSTRPDPITIEWTTPEGQERARRSRRGGIGRRGGDLNNPATVDPTAVLAERAVVTTVETFLFFSGYGTVSKFTLKGIEALTRHTIASRALHSGLQTGVSSFFLHDQQTWFVSGQHDYSASARVGAVGFVAGVTLGVIPASGSFYLDAAAKAPLAAGFGMSSATIENGASTTGGDIASGALSALEPLDLGLTGAVLSIYEQMSSDDE